MKPQARIACQVLVAAFLASPAWAADQLFYGIDDPAPASTAGPNAIAARDAFLAALSGRVVGVEDFEALAAGSFNGGSIALSFAGSTVSGTLASSTNSFAQIDAGPHAGHGTSGTHFLNVASLGSAQDRTLFTLTFGQPVTAFGFFGSSISDYAGFSGSWPSQQIAIDGGSRINVLNVNPTTVTGAAVNFFGIVSDTPFSQVTLILPGGSANDNAAIDDMLVATAVPEPSSGWLLLAGLGGAGLLRRGKGR